jgi:hypothetical protein
MASKKIVYTPRELELMVMHELGKTEAATDAVLVQILRDGGSWRAEARFKNGVALSRKDEIASQVAAIGSRIASKHNLLGM